MGIIRKEIRRGVARWIIDIRYRGKDGKRRRFRRDAQVQSRGAAEAEARRLLTQLAETGSLEVSSNERDSEAPITVEEAIQHFLLVEMPKKKPSTQRGYLAILDSEIRPRFAERPIGDLNKDLFLRLDTELAESGLSASSRRNILVVLRRVLGSVVDAGWLEHLPPLPRLPRVGRKVARAMTWEESVAILEHGTDAFRLGALLARDAGLRASEVRGLRWTDVDLNARTLTVRRAICQGVEAAPKSGHERVIPLTGELFEALVDAPKNKHQPWGPVAPCSHGTIWKESGLRAAFQAACARAGITGWRFHDLRHFFVTDLFRNGASAPVVQKLAGHEVLTTTQRYAHANDDECRAAIAAVTNTRRNTPAR